jgi:DNA-binding GntR family transcriptional regulator
LNAEGNPVNEHSSPPRQARRKPANGKPTARKPDSAMARSYEGVRALIQTYEIKPNDRLNEVELAKRFNVSRTPIREALNRLVMEQLLGFEPSVGFYRPKISAQEISDLYELRVILETEGVRLAIHRARDEELTDLAAFWTAAYNSRLLETKDNLIVADEAFHERLVALSHNDELVAALKRLNARIHFIRWADSSGEGRHEESYLQHLELLDVLRQRDEAKAIKVLRNLIVKRQEELVDILKEGAARLYIA